MKCPICGEMVADNTATCPNCQVNLRDVELPTMKTEEQNKAPVLGMGWYKFLIWFSLFAAALLNTASGLKLLTGSVYGEEADQIYAFYDGLKGLNVVTGLGLIGMAVLAIVTRISLANYKKNGPKMIVALNLISAAIGLVYVIGVNSILSAANVHIDTSSDYSSLVSSLILALINYNYFKKRAHMFVN